MELMPGFNEGGTLNQQSFSDDDADEYDDDGQYDDEDEDYDDDDDDEEEDDEFDDQGYIMNQEDLSYSGSDDEEQVAEQYLMDPEEFRMGGPSYDPLFE